MSASRANRPGMTGQPGQTRHQRWADKVLREHGYSFLRSGTNHHNVYENEHGQRVTVASTPRNEGNARRMLLQDVARHTKERPAVSTNTANPADLYLSMADTFLMTTPVDRRGKGARFSALQSWLKRVLERHGPVPSAALIEAAERIGYGRIQLQEARNLVGAASFNDSGTWKVCLPEQLPVGKESRAPSHPIELGVDPIKPELAPEEIAPKLVLQTNGKISDQQAAALMLLESLGIKQPGDDARLALLKAAEALTAARAALDEALVALA